MNDMSPYRLTIIGAIVVLVLSVGVVIVLGGPGNAATYLGLVGTVAIPGLLALFKLEQNSQATSELHTQHRAELAETNVKLDQLSDVLNKVKAGKA